MKNMEMSQLSLIDELDSDDESSPEEVADERAVLKERTKQESRRVKRWRRNVFTVIFATGALVTTLTYLFLQREDIEDFETASQKFSLSIRDALEDNLNGVVDAMRGVSEIFSSEVAISPTMDWPFVTMSSFEVLVQHTRAQASSELLVLCPIVENDLIEQWNGFSTQNQNWIHVGFEALKANQTDLNPIPSSVYRFGHYKGRTVLRSEGADGLAVAPFWQMSPPPFDTSIINFNALSKDSFRMNYETMLQTRSAVIGPAADNFLINYAVSQEDHDLLHSDAASIEEKDPGFANGHPHSSIVFPVFEELQNKSSRIVAMLVAVIPWDNYLKRLLPEGVNDIYCVLRNTCGQAFTYLISGNGVTYIGEGDYHETKFNSYEFIVDFNHILGSPAMSGNVTQDGSCNYFMSIFPSEQLASQYSSNVPLVFGTVVALCFLLMAVTFLVYDSKVVQQNNIIVDAAAQSGAIVSSLFPLNVRDRLMRQQAEKMKAESDKVKAAKRGKNVFQDKSKLADFLKADPLPEEGSSSSIFGAKPIADHFLETSIIFMDLVGFTSWSSSREPSQVFVLLETLFAAFDEIARHRKIYKVETVGDCWVGVAGLPVPRSDHAVVMCRFARDCLFRTDRLTKKLEESLGPDTGDMKIRIGIHSGPVTAGVLRGERSRFQLFGDSMNTAARMESNGMPGSIHLSEQTAAKLAAAGKSHWARHREDKINAKGKGQLQTYWLSLGGDSESFSGTSESQCQLTSRIIRLDSCRGIDETGRKVRWMVNVLSGLLRQIIASNSQAMSYNVAIDVYADEPVDQPEAAPTEHVAENILESLDENASINALNTLALEKLHQDQNVELASVIQDELSELVMALCCSYKENSFHNFSHAVHVANAAIKLLSRTKESGQSKAYHARQEFPELAADPLVQFACVFAALIHDVDHPGVPNTQLSIENPDLARVYKNKAVAEQHSLSVSWKVLHENRFTNLRRVLFATPLAESQFRALVAHAILATDVTDKELLQGRQERYNKVFSSNETAAVESNDDPLPAENPTKGLKAIILIELIIQAADVAHTMQHWDTYRKWNSYLLREMYDAYDDDRADNDPTENWLDGEKGFFDFYVIPLAQKLKDCGVFGVSGDECLSYAMENRKILEVRGNDAFTDIIEEVQHSNVIEEEALDPETAEAAENTGSAEVVIDVTEEVSESAHGSY